MFAGTAFIGGVLLSKGCVVGPFGVPEACSRCRPWSARVNAAVKRVHGLTFWCSEANLSSFIGFVVFWSKSELDGGDDASAL